MAVLSEVAVDIVTAEDEARFRDLMQAHHYLGAAPGMGETVRYVAHHRGRWLALAVFSAPALKCGARDRWIGWDYGVQFGRLHLVTNNSRFLILPGSPRNLGSRVLSLCTRRLVRDWPARFGHEVLLAETFVDPALFRGTVYRAANWIEVGRNRHSSKSAAPSLWALLERLGREHWPRLVRGDKDWGSEGNMASCEGAGLDYLFKLRLTKGARRLAERLMARDEWEDAGQGWSGIEAALRLQGWSRARRVVVLRRRLPGAVALTRSDDGQGDLFWADAQPGTGVWEFAVLATSLDLEVLSVAQLYRDRADAENGFDELKNQWGWGGFTTRDLKRCQHMARLVGLIYNWRSLFVRLADPDHHREAITSRPLLLHGVARQTRHGGQTRLTVT